MSRRSRLRRQTIRAARPQVIRARINGANMRNGQPNVPPYAAILDPSTGAQLDRMNLNGSSMDQISGEDRITRSTRTSMINHLYDAMAHLYPRR